MNQSQNNKKTILTIVGLCLLIAFLVFLVQAIFMWIPTWLPQPEKQTIFPLSQPSGQESGVTWSLLTQTEYQDWDVEDWLAKDLSDTGACWLNRYGQGQRILYLPQQDRAITAGDITASRETGEEGVERLVLRIRTSEGSEAVDPKTQLMRIGADWENFDQLPVQVILDGRELENQEYYVLGSRLVAADQAA